MPYSQILSRAFTLVRQNRALWVLGFLLALTGGGGGSGGGGGDNVSMDGSLFNGQRPDVAFDPTLLVPVILIAVLAVIALFVVFIVVRYVAQVGIIDSAARADDGERPGVRASLRRGWSGQALSLFIVHLLLSLPLIALLVVGVVAMAAVLLPTVGLGVAGEMAGLVALGVVGFIVILLPLIAVALVLGAAISLLVQWAMREVVLRGLGTIEAIQQAWQLMRANLKESILFGLLMWALGLGVEIVMIPFLLVFIGLVAGPAVLIYEASQSIVGALLYAVPVGLVGIAIILVLSGLYVAFDQTAWTLAWRHLRGVAPERVAPAPGTLEGPAFAAG